MLIESRGTNFSESYNMMHHFSYKKINFNMSPVNLRHFYAHHNLLPSPSPSPPPPPPVPHICQWIGSELVQIMACRLFGDNYPNWVIGLLLVYCWVIDNWTLGNKLNWNFNKNIKNFIHENASENIACNMAAILSGGGDGDELNMSAV